MSHKVNELSDMLNSLGSTAGKVSNFLNALQSNLTDEQKEALNKELGGAGGVFSQMNKVQEDMTKALKDLDNLNKQ